MKTKIHVLTAFIVAMTLMFACQASARPSDYKVQRSETDEVKHSDYGKAVAARAFTAFRDDKEKLQPFLRELCLERSYHEESVVLFEKPKSVICSTGQEGKVLSCLSYSYTNNTIVSCSLIETDKFQ